MGTDLLPKYIRDHYEVHEWKHACAILKNDFPDEWKDLIDLLTNFKLYKSWILKPGGSKTKVASKIDNILYERGWQEKGFHTSVSVDDVTIDSPTHKVDCFKNKVALEVEWNSKDTSFDRDLNNFRLLFELRAISVGIIITRCDSLKSLFEKLGKKYYTSTSHMSKLLPRIEGGGGAGCPLLVIGINSSVYREERPTHTT